MNPPLYFLSHSAYWARFSSDPGYLWEVILLPIYPILRSLFLKVTTQNLQGTSRLRNQGKKKCKWEKKRTLRTPKMFYHRPFLLPDK